MKIIVLGYLGDLQTGTYVHNSLIDAGHESYFINMRQIIMNEGMEKGQQIILDELEDVYKEPDLVLVLKGLELKPETVKTIRDKYPKAIFANWFFDVYLADKPIWKQEEYFPVLRMYDFFFCSLKGVADKLQAHGFTNAFHLPEACYPKRNGPAYANSFQKKKYGEDISFCGSLGFTEQHKNRIDILKSVAKECYNFKVWGNIVGEENKIGVEILESHMFVEATNETHSVVAENSKINLGIDQDPTLEQSWSARLYRVLCAGGLYLTTETRGLNKVFKCYPNEGEFISDDQELVVFKGKDDLIKKIDYLLEHDDLRKKIAENGQKKVLAKHTFINRIEQMLEMINNV